MRTIISYFLLICWITCGSAAYAQDRQVKVLHASASSAQRGEGAEYMIDGNPHTIYHSPYDNVTAVNTYFPITLTFHFRGTEQVDYLVYTPRKDGGINGFFREVDLYVKSKNTPEYVFLKTYDFQGSPNTTIVMLGNEPIRPESIRLVVRSGVGDRQGFVSCAEMQFFQRADEAELRKVFTDPLCTTLQPAVNKKDLKALPYPELQQLAEDLRTGQYQTHYRVASYQAVPDPGVFERKMILYQGYTRNQGVTGIVISPGRQLVLAEGIPDNHSVSLNVAKWYAPDAWSEPEESYPLHNGLNLINHTADWDGLAYISYHHAEGEKLPPVQVHFVNATVNGYFDATHQNNTEWDAVLAQTVFPVVDLVGKHVQLAFPVKNLRKHAISKGVELVTAYDHQIKVQYDLMGYTKYGHIPTNRIQAKVVNTNLYYMFRDKKGVSFSLQTADFVCNPDTLRNSDTWGVSHEFGHVHQVIPYFTWAGMVEVSNNLCSMYMQTQVMNLPNRLVYEKRYEGAFRSYLQDHKALMEADDVFQRLVPFWQLYLYFKKKGYTDFYPDLYERLRHTRQEKEMPAWAGNYSNWLQVEWNPRQAQMLYQLNFVKKASQTAGINLIPFFERYGFLVPGRLMVDNVLFELTPQQLELFKKDLDPLGLHKLTEEELEQMLTMQE